MPTSKVMTEALQGRTLPFLNSSDLFAHHSVTTDLIIDSANRQLPQGILPGNYPALSPAELR